MASPRHDSGKAKLWLVLLTFAWGLNWPIMKIALDEMQPWTLRALGYVIGSAALFALLKATGRSPFAIPGGRAWLHIAVAGFLNIVAFSLLSSFAQLAATTSRVVIITYSMPIWACLMAWVALGERLTVPARIGLLLCALGLAVLVAPVVSAQSAGGLLLALGCALSWGAGTVYMKWAKIPADLLVVTTWQMSMGAVVLSIGFLLAEGPPTFAPVSLDAMLAVAYSALVGSSLAFILWFSIIERLPTSTASLGLLGSPVVGIAASVLLLGERPTTADVVGFTLILAAAVCVLLPARRAIPAQATR